MKIIIELSGTTTTIENKDAENIHEAYEMFRCALLGAGYSEETVNAGFASSKKQGKLKYYNSDGNEIFPFKFF
jgi:hypothetical protein